MKLNRNIYNFENYDEFRYYLECFQLQEEIGRGSEGVCYLSSLDNRVYKVLTNYFRDKKDVEDLILAEDVITTSDIDLKSFALPEDLYALRSVLIGYNARFVAPDLFDVCNSNKFASIYRIDFDKLLRAYYEMLIDIEKLSDDKIRIYDLNLMFTGEHLVGIDTFGYKKVCFDSFNDNQKQVDDSIKLVIDTLMINSGRFRNSELAEIFVEEDVELYIGKVKKLIKR